MSEREVITIDLADLENASDESIIMIDDSELPEASADFDKPAIMMKEPTDTVLLIDTSGSMGADDYPPDRLTAAKTAARMFTMRKVIQNYQDRVAVFGFGSTPTLVHPLDSDLDKVATSIDQLSITHSGTLIGPAIQAAQQELHQSPTKRQVIVLLSDGADQFDNSKPAAVAQAGKGIKVFTIGIGTLKGGQAQLPHGMQKVVLNEEVLKQIAKVTGGEYLYAPDVFQLQAIYTKLADY